MFIADAYGGSSPHPTQAAPTQSKWKASKVLNLSEVISSSNSTWSCLCFYFSRSLPRKHWTQKCPPRLPDFLQNQSQITAKLNSFPQWVMCVSMVQKNMKKPISSVRFGHFFRFKKRSDFFLELYLLLPLCLLVKNAPRETFEHRMWSQVSQMTFKISK